MTHDLVIRGGTILDGRGGDGSVGDVAVDDGRITAVGNVNGERGREVVDAEGCVVTPGFIDGHTHLDAQLFWDPFGTSSCWHGVTTVVMGNCGFTLAPARDDARALVVRNLERAEDMDAAALAAGIDWQWETFPQYLDAVDRRPKAINYAAQIGHSALRTWAMGDRAFEEVASDEDLAVMEHELRASLLAGAVGFTTSRSDQHETSDDRPVASRVGTWDEVCRLVGVLGDLGAGVFELATPLSRGTDPETRARVIADLKDLALTTGVPMTFGVAASRSGRNDVFDLIDETLAAGGRMFGQSHSRGISVVMSFLTRLPFDKLPLWSEIRALPPDEQLHALRDESLRRKLVDEAHHGDYGRSIGAETPKPDYTRMRVFNRPVPPNPTVADAAAARGVDPVELVLDLAIDTDLRQLFSQPLTSDDDKIVLETLRYPHAVMTFSDSGAHVSQIADSSIQTHLLAYWVREREAFTIGEAVRMLTQVPAEAWGFDDRGVLREGAIADLNVFDPARVAPAMPTVVHDLPAGARRLVQRATGFRATIVSGEVVLRDGEHTGSLPGQLVRGPLARMP
ncbi:MAG TPA: amidohydrolase family protein [Acidimicrobiia bacterium]|nr:amidohydrolase family protein [Acidimicrobiia bacterium]